MTDKSPPSKTILILYNNYVNVAECAISSSSTSTSNSKMWIFHQYEFFNKVSSATEYY